MLSFDVADRRIEAHEKELARLQADVTTPSQLELNLVREELKITLRTASTIARVAVEVLDKLGDSFEDSVERAAKDLNGR
jgi:hypothetical protein